MQNLDVVFSDDWIIVLFFILGALLHGITGFGYCQFLPIKSCRGDGGSAVCGA